MATPAIGGSTARRCPTGRSGQGSLNLGGLGVAALAAPWGQTVQAKSASTLADRNFPRRYASAFVRPRVLTPYERTVDADGAPCTGMS